MQRLLAIKTVSMVELREPGKVIAEAGGGPVAILKDNKCVGCFVPVERVSDICGGYVSVDAVMGLFRQEREDLQPALDDLRDK